MHAINNLPEDPDRIYPKGSFVDTVTGKREYVGSFWYGSTGSPFAMSITDQSTFMLTVHLLALQPPA